MQTDSNGEATEDRPLSYDHDFASFSLLSWQVYDLWTEHSSGCSQHAASLMACNIHHMNYITYSGITFSLDVQD